MLLESSISQKPAVADTRSKTGKVVWKNAKKSAWPLSVRYSSFGHDYRPGGRSLVIHPGICAHRMQRSRFLHCDAARHNQLRQLYLRKRGTMLRFQHLLSQQRAIFLPEPESLLLQ